MGKRNVFVIGNGALALSIAGQMAAREALVTYYNPCGEVLPDTDFKFKGALNYNFTLSKMASDYSAVPDAEIIVICVSPSQSHKVFAELLPYLKTNHNLILFPAYFGALALKIMLKKINLPDITISEVVSFPCICEMEAPGILQVLDVKQYLRMAVSPASRAEELLELYNEFFDILSLSQNFLETSLDNINIVLHPLPILLNVSAVERNTEEFHHFIDGVSHTVGRLVEQADQERLEVGRAYGLNLTSTMKQLVLYYGKRKANNITDYISSEDGPYANVKGYGLHSRYITEDVPYTVVFTESLAHSAGIHVPVISASIDIASLIHGNNYRKTGVTLDSIGLKNASIEIIRQEVNT